ncbi:MAG: preprotein translocase subunit SecE [candidate division KSB1 bacterium]|nr:preprotein translocase subunit SecE [candidate division KSB1 bacterium]MDZ7367990.1 preprotein translocase subunit SecE [candidate division KSB1 bacterium]MDZ7405613.1 preprotein translocase subunit SecE [candidate division KSB1 bacterium]
MALVGKVKKFAQDVRLELSKVSWPTRDELWGSTGVVIVFSLLFAVYTFGADQILQVLVKLLLSAN